MPVVSLGPPRALLRLQEALDRLHRNPGLGLSTLGSPALTVFPPINVFSDESALVVRAEVPGFAPDQLDVVIQARGLTISGERQPHAPDGDGSYHRRERQFGKFKRTIPLPDDLAPDGAEAQCRDGVLTVRIPKQAEARPKKVSIVQG